MGLSDFDELSRVDFDELSRVAFSDQPSVIPIFLMFLSDS
jgi:hypothetical protein